MEKIIDGKGLSQAYGSQLKERISLWTADRGICPGLAIVQCSGDPSSQVYVNSIVKTGERYGVAVKVHTVDSQLGTEAVGRVLDQLNRDPLTHGIIVQFPLPPAIDAETVRQRISPDKDVDSAGYSNIGKLYGGTGGFVPCTPKGMMLILKSLGIPLKGLHGVVVGRSNVVGKPVAQLMLNEHMTVTLCHSKTRDLASVTRQADVLMTGVGVPGLIGPEHLQEGAIVIDAGINVIDGGIVGDVRWKDCVGKAAAITPVPGGVGPTTNIMLMENTLEACIRLSAPGQSSDGPGAR